MAKFASESQKEWIVKISAELGVAPPPVSVLDVMKGKAASDLLDSLFAMRKQVQKNAEAAALSGVPAWEPGKQNLALSVVVVKYKETAFGTQKKVLAKDAQGRKLWMTMPAAAGEFPFDQMKGWEFTVTVTVQTKDDDPHFAFGSRPSEFVWTYKGDGAFAIHQGSAVAAH